MSTATVDRRSKFSWRHDDVTWDTEPTKSVIPELVKVGPKGYVHGWIKVGKIDNDSFDISDTPGPIVDKKSGVILGYVGRSNDRDAPVSITHADGTLVSLSEHARYGKYNLVAHHNKAVDAISRDNPVQALNAEERVVASQFENLNRYDSIAGGECHDVALGTFQWALRHGFTKPLVHSHGNHTWVDAEINGHRIVIDPVAVNQGFGKPFTDVASDTAEVRHRPHKTYSSLDGYVAAEGNKINAEWDKSPSEAGDHLADELDSELGPVTLHAGKTEKAAKDLHDPNPVDAEHVYQQLLQNYPPDSVSWVRDIPWIGPIEIPLDRIDWDGKDSWAASHQKKRVKRFVKRIHNGGEDVHPIVGVQVPGDDRVKVIDGHHRALAYQKEGKPAKAYVGFAPSDDSDSPWFQAHLYQKKQGADPANKSEVWLVFGEYGSHGKLKIRLAELVKVGPEGYIHGYICVRPPCGPRYAQAKFDSGKGTVFHGDNDVRVGKMRKNDDGTYSMVHHAGDGKSKLTARYASRKDAAESVALYHNVDVLHREATQSRAAAAVPELAAAKDALAAGDREKAIDHLANAQAKAEDAGDRGLATHIGDTRNAVEHGPQPVHGETVPVPAPAPALELKPVPVPKPAPAPEVPVQHSAPEVPVLHETPSKTGKPFVPVMPKRSVSHTRLNAAEIQAEAQQLAEDGRNIPGIEYYNSPLNSMRSLADRLKSDVSKTGDSEKLYPHEGKLGNELIPADALTNIKWDMDLVDQTLAEGRVPYSSAKPLTREGREYLKKLKARMQALHDKIAAADTSEPFTPGGFTSGMLHEPRGGFEDHLSKKEADELHQLIANTNLQFPKDNPGDREDSSSEVANRMDHLKTKFVESSLKDAGLPDNAAYILSGGTKPTGYADPVQAPNGLGVAGMIGDWTMTGDNAQEVVDMYKRSNAMTEPPAIRVTDFAGARRGSYSEGWVYSDMSPDAVARRNAATDYWVPRAQQHYTDQVMKDVAVKPTVKAVRFVFGSYGNNIMERQSMGMPWSAHDRGMSSWAEPKGARSSQAFVRMFVPDERPPQYGYRGQKITEKPKFVKLTTNAPVSKVAAHWRGEGTLRNGVKALGEVILKDPDMNEKTTVAEYVQ